MASPAHEDNEESDYKRNNDPARKLFNVEQEAKVNLFRTVHCLLSSGSDSFSDVPHKNKSSWSPETPEKQSQSWKRD